MSMCDFPEDMQVKINKDTDSLVDEENEHDVQTRQDEWKQANQKSKFVRDMIVLSQDSEKHGRWSGFMTGIGVGILGSLSVLGWIFGKLAKRRIVNEIIGD